ncbi:hypothetical protein C2S52_021663 [Perilla frutescens var. hirtella]|nr:hypothetical protein C2S52_021663 [Perilla frutescens var. hirtella]
MVLSNKKLKHKLRAAKAELITASGAENNFTDKKYEKSQDFDSKASDFLRTILDLEAQRSKLSKRARPKRVKQRQTTLTENADIIENGEISGNVELQIQDGLNSDAMQVEKKKKTKKRKRDESESSENMKEKRKKKKKKKRDRYWWLEKKKNKDKNKTEVVDNGEVKEEGVNQNEKGSTGERLVAKANERIDCERKNVEMSQKVYVGGIPYYSTEDDIRSYFEGCGTITCIDCMTFPDTGKFRGIAIITFKTEAATKRALALDGSDMGGLFLKVQPYKSDKVNKLPNFSPSVMEGYNRIYVGNLSWDITENDLRNIFAECSIKSIRFGEDKETGEFKGYAHVDLADSLSVNAALKLDQTVVCGRPVRITCALLKKGTAAESKPLPKDIQVDSGKEEEVTAAILKATPEDILVDNGNASAAVENEVTSSGTDAALSSKIRRRTCYECGEKGHLSSSCPKKQAADSTNPGTA